MRVLQVGKYYPPVNGGIENNVHALCTGLASRYEVSTLVFNTRRQTVEEELDGVKVVRVGTFGKLLSTEIAPGFIPWFFRLRDADIIHLHTPNPIGELACLAVPPSARFVVTYHSDVVRQRLLGRANRLVLHRLLRRADRIIAYTERYMRTSPVLARYADKCAIIPHGVDLAEFDATPGVASKTEALRARYGPRIVLFVGRLVYYKGIDTLLSAIARLPQTRLLVVGDGPMRPSLEAMARQLGLADRAHFLGRQSHEDKVACYRAADLLVLAATHRSEAFGQVQVEALACGRPVVSTNIDSGVPFVNRHEVTGLVVEPRKPAALADAVRTLLDDPERRRRYGLAGRERVERLFSRDVMTRDCMRLYEEVLGASNLLSTHPSGAR